MIKKLYEDSKLLVIDKPAGYDMIALEAKTQGVGFVHRLDRDTSGVLVFAKTEEAREELVAQWQERTVKKVYIALIKGHIHPDKGAIDAPIGRRFRDRKRMGVMPSEDLGRSSITYYEVVQYFDATETGLGIPVTLVHARPKTGRTHQIRVHFQAIGFPIVGDTKYGDRKLNKKFEQLCGLDRQFLHASKLTFKMPGTNRKKTFIAPLPDDLENVLCSLGG